MLQVIAARFKNNIRELEGSLTRVVAYSRLTGEPLSGERLMAVAVVLGGVALGVYASARRLR